jgi:hypothetical protein
MLEMRETYLVKRRSFPDSDASRFTHDEAGFLSILRLQPGRGANVNQ